jgi:hypothetical protein
VLKERGLFDSEPSIALRIIEKSGWVMIGILSTGAFLFVSSSFAAGIALGGILSLLNFRCVELYFVRIFREKKSGTRWWHHTFYGLRFLFLLGAVAVAISWGQLPVVGMVLGLSAPFLGILYFAILALSNSEIAAKV